MSWGRTTGRRDGGKLRHREAKALAQGRSASPRLHRDGTRGFFVQAGICPGGSGPPGARIPAAARVARAAEERESSASPGNSLEPSRGLYSGSQNIWLRIGRGRRGCGWPVPWLPVLPRCFLPIAGPSGLISDPKATARTAPPFPYTHRGQAVLAQTGAAGIQEEVRASSPWQVVGR